MHSKEIINPNKDIQIPNWVTKEYFRDIVSKDEPEAIEIENFIPIAAVPPGDNFTSIMLRIHMDLKMKGLYEMYWDKDLIDDGWNDPC